MSDIKTFRFSKDHFKDIRKYHFGFNWPVVYILEDGKEIYIGESTNAYNRSRQHFEKPERAKLKNIHIITDFEYNKSAALDIESMLIQHIAADDIFIVQNGNKGLSNHNYYEREKYQKKFELLWEELRKTELADKSSIQIKNSQIFKYSPYKSLTEDQIEIVKRIKKVLKNKESKTMIIDGSPGTGKTILATYLMKNLIEHNDFKELEIGFVVPMMSLRNTIKKVFSQVKNLKSGMVIGPSDVVKKKYDLLIVDESHRLTQRKNIVNYKSYDDVNKKIGLDKEATQLDWILKSSKYQIFFYDKNQSIKPADINQSVFSKMDALRLNLKKQIRVKGGEKYINFISSIFDLEPKESNFEDYDFRIFDDVKKMIKEIKERNKECELSRVVAGFAWPWETRNGADYDIEIDGLKLKWNSVTNDWVNSENSINEVGCIHTVQGYDLNYTGVIIGPELTYDPKAHKLNIDEAKYKDMNGKRSINDPEELRGYIINIYKTLLARGIYGTYVYVCDENLRQFLKDAVDDVNFT